MDFLHNYIQKIIDSKDTIFNIKNKNDYKITTLR